MASICSGPEAQETAQGVSQEEGAVRHTADALQVGSRSKGPALFSSLAQTLRPSRYHFLRDSLETGRTQRIQPSACSGPPSSPIRSSPVAQTLRHVENDSVGCLANSKSALLDGPTLGNPRRSAAQRGQRQRELAKQIQGLLQTKSPDNVRSRAQTLRRRVEEAERRLEFDGVCDPTEALNQVLDKEFEINNPRRENSLLGCEEPIAGWRRAASRSSVVKTRVTASIPLLARKPSRVPHGSTCEYQGPGPANTVPDRPAGFKPVRVTRGDHITTLAQIKCGPDVSGFGATRHGVQSVSNHRSNTRGASNRLIGIGRHWLIAAASAGHCDASGIHGVRDLPSPLASTGIHADQASGFHRVPADFNGIWVTGP
ncbi:hypothetical protein DFH08DRAFT_822909 [Mycena albidolilacea]|uniref:Uncharacterized protein n=1 Tax=Mycena albidolilacea TaxID=1033008 RepID=A0AAD6Z861_9AGAR|nr:hypothetical protein DFH08DRAFT_822909 [Mycena albidolilacea]